LAKAIVVLLMISTVVLAVAKVDMTAIVPADTVTLPADTASIIVDTGEAAANVDVIPAAPVKVIADTAVVPVDTVTIAADTAAVTIDTIAVIADTAVVAVDTVAIVTDTADVIADTAAIAVDTAVIDTVAAVIDTIEITVDTAAIAVVDSVAAVDSIATVVVDTAVAVVVVRPPPPPPKVYPIVVPYIDMVLVKGGKIRRGCRSSDDNICLAEERPRHEIKLKNFKISRYPITQMQWGSVMGVSPAHFRGDSLPVEQVSWNDVQEFIKRLNAMTGKKYRLPTEAEWEYAALGGVKASDQNFSGHKFLDDVAWYKYNSGGRTQPVGQKEPNELGIYDMRGNVWEWVNDWYDNNYYRNSPFANPKGPKHGRERIYRGGAFNSEEINCRISQRNSAKPDYKLINIGFRLVHAQ